MKKSEAKRRISEIENEANVENRASNLNRARSITVGTAFGGTTEIMMRSDGGRHLWCVMQPVEVVELIHQLAANVGCHIAIKPREDFSSWRGWQLTEAEKLHYQNHAPFVNDMAPFARLGADPKQTPQELTEEQKKELADISNGKGNLSLDKKGDLANTFLDDGSMLGGAGGLCIPIESKEK